MRWLIPILVTLICGCTLGQSTSSGTGGAGGSTATSVCEPSGATCTSCTSCAIDSPCADLYQTCQSNSDCMTIDECFEGCSGDSSCQQGCLDANPNGDTEYTNLLTCVNCEQCPTACSGLCSN